MLIQLNDYSNNRADQENKTGRVHDPQQRKTSNEKVVKMPNTQVKNPEKQNEQVSIPEMPNIPTDNPGTPNIFHLHLSAENCRCAIIEFMPSGIKLQML